MPRSARSPARRRRSPRGSAASCARSGSRSTSPTQARQRAGNLLARRPRRRSAACCSAPTSTPCRTTATVEPVCVDGGWVSAGDTILGADNKAAVAVLLARRAARGDRGRAGRPRAAVHRRRGDRAARRQGVRRLAAAQRRSATSSTTPRRSARSSMASPTYYRLEAQLPRRRRPRRHPARGRPQRDRRRRAGDRRDAPGPHRRGDDRQRRLRSAAAAPARPTSSPSARRSWPRRAASTRTKVEALVAEMVDHVHDAANDAGLRVRRRRRRRAAVHGYRHRPQAPAVRRRRGRAARLRLRAARASSPAAARTPTRSRPRASRAPTSPTAPSATTRPTSASPSPRWRACSTSPTRCSTGRRGRSGRERHGPPLRARSAARAVHEGRIIALRVDRFRYRRRRRRSSARSSATRARSAIVCARRARTCARAPAARGGRRPRLPRAAGRQATRRARRRWHGRAARAGRGDRQGAPSTGSR